MIWIQLTITLLLYYFTRQCKNAHDLIYISEPEEPFVWYFTLALVAWSSGALLVLICLHTCLHLEAESEANLRVGSFATLSCITCSNKKTRVCTKDEATRERELSPQAQSSKSLLPIRASRYSLMQAHHRQLSFRQLPWSRPCINKVHNRP
jgi:hypothetical protein